MEKIILRSEAIIAAVITIAYGAFVLWIVTDKIFDFSLLQRPTTIDYHYYGYGFIVILLVLHILKESLIYSRINSEESELISRGVVWLEVMKLLVLVGGHVLFWVCVLNDYDVFISLIYLVLGYVSPKFISNSVYVSNDYIAYNGIKYYYKQIEECSHNGFSSIDIIIDGKKHDITWWEADESEKVYKYMKEIIEERVLVADANNCT